MFPKYGKSLVECYQAFKFKFGLDRKSIVIKHIKRNDVTAILEIGVFNGNFANRMIAAASKNMCSEIVYVGVDLFAEGFNSEIYHSEVSLQPLERNVILDRLSRFENVKVELLAGNSREILPNIDGNSKFDLIIVDGGHSYETVKQDWENVQKLVSDHGTVFFDDYANSLGVQLGGFGVNCVVDEIDLNKFEVSISNKTDYFVKSYGLLKLKLAKVKKIQK